MCGICGFVDLSRQMNHGDLQAVIGRMTDSLEHRGPDDSGMWLSPEIALALGQRRLSILDLSMRGHQPMVSACGRYTVVFNGEIYNFHVLRKALEETGHVFSGASDTEVLLAAVAQWGIHKALMKFTGMFAFALFDRDSRTLYLARDRLGEKPLYYGWSGNRFLFASELKALRQMPGWAGTISPEALSLYMRYTYIRAPHSIYSGIYKLAPGTFVAMDVEKASPDSLPEPVPYWTFEHAVESGLDDPFEGTEEEATEHVANLLRSAISLQMISDVPLGAFLSGGLDSSTIVALMQDRSSKSVKTFTVGFHESNYNEAEQARRVAEYLGTDHTEVCLSYGQAIEVIPRLPFIYDEPFADSSQIPTFLIAKVARESVKVCLSGDAGDEIFLGYNRYLWGERLWNSAGSLPVWLKIALSRMISAVPLESVEAALTRLTDLLRTGVSCRHLGTKLQKVERLLMTETFEAFYSSLISSRSGSSVLIAESNGHASFPKTGLLPILQAFAHKAAYLDTMTYLPDDILVKVDRAAMAVSLETRIPFLDHRLVEFAWRLPLSLKVRKGTGKWVLRNILYKYVPKELVDRPKTGFDIPIGLWLRGPLRDWAESLLDRGRLDREGYFHTDQVRKKWHEHLSGRRNWQQDLWSVLMFQAWLEQE